MLRTPYIDAAHHFAPTEAPLPQVEWGRRAPVGVKHRLVYYYPDGPMFPYGAFGKEIPNAHTLRMDRSAHHFSSGGWAAPNTWANGHACYVSSSPWGAAIRHDNNGVGNTGSAACFESGPHATTMETLGFGADYYYTVFAIVRPSGGSRTQVNVFLTHGGGVPDWLQFGYLPSNEWVYATIGGVPGATDITAYQRADGWLQLALMLTVEWTGPITHAGYYDLWVNGTKVRDRVGGSFETILTRPTRVTVGANNEYKDGFSWDGDIAQVACVMHSTKEIAGHQIRQWFHDPWFFLKAERVNPPEPKVSRMEVSGGAECFATPDGEGEVSGWLDGSEEADAEVGPAGASTSGALSGGAEVGGRLEGESDGD